MKKTRKLQTFDFGYFLVKDILKVMECKIISYFNEHVIILQHMQMVIG